MRSSLTIAVLALACTAAEPTPEAGPTLFFEDVTEAAGINFTHAAPVGALPYGTGAAWLDCDDDGDQDLWLTQRQGPSALYENNGGVFTNIAASAGIADEDADRAGVSVADYDNDGVLDAFVARNGQSILYRGLGGCLFEEVVDAGVAGDGATQSGSWGDFDGDGWLDLATVDHTSVELPAPEAEPARQLRLFVNNQDGSFTASDALPTESPPGSGFAATWIDVDDDGDQDLYTVNDAFPGLPGNRYYENDDGVFTERSAAVGLDVEQSGMGLAVGDVDNDGRMDLAVSNIGRLALRMQQSSGEFLEQAADLGAGRDRYEDDSFTTWGIAFADFDNDGWQDLFAAGGGLTGYSRYDLQHNGIWHNTGGRFEESIEGSGGEMEDGSGRSLAIADANQDGSLDVWITNYAGQGRLLQSRPTDAHWLAIELEGVQSNRSGIGAKLTLTTDDGAQTRWVHSGSSLGSSHDIAAHFGMADQTSGELEIFWPSGVTQTLSVDADQRLHIVEAADR
ncbi:MAG: CRTAC1 family protein [Proteobacteria bacterium]|nr:CRTAC1 family protein [Pseudomonadota bacterium]